MKVRKPEVPAACDWKARSSRLIPDLITVFLTLVKKKKIINQEVGKYIDTANTKLYCLTPSNFV